MSDSDTLKWLVFADDLSARREPPKWRVVAHWMWRQHSQPSDVLRAVLAALRGEYEPIRSFGVPWVPSESCREDHQEPVARPPSFPASLPDYKAALDELRTMFYPNDFSEDYALEAVTLAVNAAVGLPPWEWKR